MTDGTQEPPPRVPHAPATGPADTQAAYELCNVFGTPTGRRIVLAAGASLPLAPKGWSWRPVSDD